MLCSKLLEKTHKLLLRIRSHGRQTIIQFNPEEFIPAWHREWSRILIRTSLDYWPYLSACLILLIIIMASAWPQQPHKRRESIRLSRFRPTFEFGIRHSGLAREDPETKAEAELLLTDCLSRRKTRVEALESIKRLSPRLEISAPIYKFLLSSDGNQFKARVLEALGDCAARSRFEVHADKHLDALNKKQVFEWKPSYALDSCLRLVAQNLNSEDWDVRYFAVYAHVAMSPLDKTKLPWLIEAILRDDFGDNSKDTDLLIALRLLDPKNKEVLEQLKTMMMSPDEADRVVGAEGLGIIADQASIELLRGGLRDWSTWVRYFSAQSIINHKDICLSCLPELVSMASLSRMDFDQVCHVLLASDYDRHEVFDLLRANEQEHPEYSKTTKKIISELNAKMKIWW